MTSYAIHSLADRPDLMDGVFALDELWPQFLLKDLCSRLIDSDLRLADWVFAIVADDDEARAADPDVPEGVVGRAVSVPVHWASDGERFPDRGWDAAIVDSVRLFQQGLDPTTMCLLEVTLRRSARDGEVSRLALREAKRIAGDRGLDSVCVPVRPAGKSRHVDLTMAEYIDLRDRDGLPIDTWLRLHLEEGARLVRVAPMSMVVAGTLGEWRDWTGLDLAEGAVSVPGALVPITVRAADGVAVYVEPNVWVEHPV